MKLRCAALVCVLVMWLVLVRKLPVAADRKKNTEYPVLVSAATAKA